MNGEEEVKRNIEFSRGILHPHVEFCRSLGCLDAVAVVSLCVIP